MAIPMAGRRKNNPLGLLPRVYAKRGKFWYVHRDNHWENLGGDVDKANTRARLYNDSQGSYGTMSYWLDMFVVDCAQRVKAGTLAQRTLDDYTDAVEPLKLYFAPPMLPGDIEPKHVQIYLDIGHEAGRPVRANREKAALSSCISWLIREGHVDDLLVNPCLRASGIKRNRENKRERYVNHDEYREVCAQAPAQVKAMMELTYRTLQRPESDILGWTLVNLPKKDGQRILRVRQQKVKGTTGRVIDIALSPDLDALLSTLVGDVPQIGRTLICAARGKHAGKPYTYDGISAMLKRAIGKANAERVKAGREKIASFGFRDLKGKGATDMWQSGIPLEDIQLLCGHEDKTTTEIYVKQRWRETARPNVVVMGAA
jgi:integrase